jgi:hypothetical protein
MRERQLHALHGRPNAIVGYSCGALVDRHGSASFVKEATGSSSQRVRR